MSTKKSPLFEGATGHPVDVTSKQGITIRFTQRDEEVWHGLVEGMPGMLVTLTPREPNDLAGVLHVVCEISGPNERWMADGICEDAALTNAVANCAPLLATLAEPIPPATALPPVLPPLEGYTLWIPRDAIGVVLRVPEETTHAQAGALRAAWNRTFPTVPAMVLTPNIDVKVLRMTTDPALPAPPVGAEDPWAKATAAMTGPRMMALRTRLQTIGCTLDLGVRIGYQRPPNVGATRLDAPIGRHLAVTIGYSASIAARQETVGWYDWCDLDTNQEVPPTLAQIDELLGRAERHRGEIARYA